MSFLVQILIGLMYNAYIHFCRLGFWEQGLFTRMTMNVLPAYGDEVSSATYNYN